jgi:hypothetical protein
MNIDKMHETAAWNNLNLSIQQNEADRAYLLDTNESLQSLIENYEAEMSENEQEYQRKYQKKYQYCIRGKVDALCQQVCPVHSSANCTSSRMLNTIRISSYCYVAGSAT